MRTFLALALTAITFNLFAIVDGVKFCQHTDLGGLCSETTSTIFNLDGTYWYYWNGQYLVPVSRNDAISSIQVGYNWEVYVCSNNNNSGTCKVFWNDDPVYQYSGKTFNMTDYSMNDLISSLTVQPRTFERARNFYTYSDRVPPQANHYEGYAYVYQHGSYYLPTTQGATSGFRLFLKVGDNITNLSNYIVKNNQISSALLFGNVTAHLYTGTNYSGSFKKLTSSHRDFSLAISPYSYTIWNLTTWQDNVESLKLQSSTGSFGMFIASDTVMQRNGETCFEFQAYFSDARHECQKYGQTWYPVESLGATDYITQLKRRSSALAETFLSKGDNFDLLWIEAHGAHSDNNDYIQISAAQKGLAASERLNISASDNGEFAYWDSYIGTINTDNFYTGACYSMLPKGTDYATQVIPIWIDSLEHLHGVGGMRSTADWLEDGLDPYDRNDVWEQLDTYPVGESWVDAMEMEYLGYERWPRFITREKYDCTTHPADTYMYYDYFPGISSGPMLDKGILSEYDYYCVRFADDQDDDLNSYYIPTKGSFDKAVLVQPIKVPDILTLSSRQVRVAMAEKSFEVYESEFEPVESVFTKLGLQNKSVEISEKGKTVFYDDGAYKLAMRDRGYNLYSTRPLEIIEHHFDVKSMKEELREEAEMLARSLTTLPLVFDKVAEDASVSFQQVDDSIVKTGRVVNKIRYIFHPVIDDIAVFDSGIIVQYDANGLYKLSSNVPYRVTRVKTIENLKSAENVVVEIAAKTGTQEDFDATKVLYAMRKDGLMIPVYIYKQENIVRAISLDEELPIEMEE